MSSPAAHAEVTLDGTLGPGGPLAGPDYAISDNLGQLRGSNLFHSFGKFNISTGESATFTGPTSVANILGRVTGGSASLIDGRLSSQIPGANLYLMNPSGLMFGPNATLDISGSFHATTADYIGLADGGRFDAAEPANSVLTTAPPVAFGFLGDNPRPLEIGGSELVVADDQTISLVGGDISIVGNASENESVRSPGGRINIVSVASPGEVSHETEADAVGPELASFERLGSISLTEGARVSASSEHGGSVFIRGGRFTADASTVFAAVRAPTESQSTIEGEGIGIDIATRGEIELSNGSEIATNVVNGGRADSGGVRIKAGEVNLSGGAQINSVVFGAQTLDDGTVLPPGAGNSGDIEIEATRTVSVTEGAWIRSNTGGSGDSGSVLIQSQSLDVLEGGLILTLAFGGGSGNAGDIQVDANTVRLSSTPPFPFTAITSQTFNDGTTGAAGDVRITADSLQLTGSAFISSLTFDDAGPGGNVTVSAGDVLLSGSPDNFTMGIFTNTLGTGTGGRLSLSAENLELRTRSSLQARTLGPGDAGGASIEVSGSLSMAEGSFITTSSNFGTGDGADLAISAGRLSIVGAADSTDPFGFDFTGLSTATNDGRGGNLSITAGSVELSDTASIRANSEGVGDAGSITLDVAGDVSVMNGAQITTFADDAGNAGDITIRADRMLVSGLNVADAVDPETGKPVFSTTSVSTQTQSETASAGDVSIEVGALEVLDGGRIESRTLGKGAGGDIHIVADRVLVSDDNVLLGELLDKPAAGVSMISTLADGVLFGVAATGDAGNITIEANDVQIVNKGALAANTTTPGAGGTIDISADRVTVSGDGRIRSVSEIRAQAGDAGDVVITARELYQSDGGIVSSAAGGAGLDAKASGGSVNITAGDVYLSNGAFVSARNNGGGDGGSVTLTVDGTFTNDGSTVTATAQEGKGGEVAITAGRDIRLNNGARVTAETAGPGDAGGVTLVAGDSIRLEGSTALTKASEADGGNIVLTAQDLVYLLDSEITSSVGGGVTTVGGNITIDPRFVVLNKSDVRANAREGQGGNILIVTDSFIKSADSTVTASSEFGVDGDVVIRSPQDTVIVGAEALPESFLDVSSLLSERCAARTEAKVGSFVVLGRGGVPPGPDAALSSSDIDMDTQTDARSTSTTDSHEAGRSVVVVRKGRRLVSGAQAVNGMMPARLVFSCGN